MVVSSSKPVSIPTSNRTYISQDHPTLPCKRRLSEGKSFSNFFGFNAEKFKFSLDSTQRKFKFLWIHKDAVADDGTLPKNKDAPKGESASSRD
ncbi:hypothetical protein HYC85_025098 [Camellia sinensis]|uniref:Uncharacterized protein n=1 Tax=Camellia sinensis TaxID=4442 RepID=A0A7J7GA00_CAMSI|nr:hypothetical protein HYC85_025098 [Camellia sinensis]